MATARPLLAQKPDIELTLTHDEAAVLHHLLYRGIGTESVEPMKGLNRIWRALEPHVQSRSLVISHKWRWEKYAMAARITE